MEAAQDTKASKAKLPTNVIYLLPRAETEYAVAREAIQLRDPEALVEHADQPKRCVQELDLREIPRDYVVVIAARGLNGRSKRPMWPSRYDDQHRIYRSERKDPQEFIDEVQFTRPIVVKEMSDKGKIKRPEFCEVVASLASPLAIHWVDGTTVADNGSKQLPSVLALI